MMQRIEIKRNEKSPQNSILNFGGYVIYLTYNMLNSICMIFIFFTFGGYF